MPWYLPQGQLACPSSPQNLLAGHTLAVGAVESLVALGAVSTHFPTYRPWLLHPCVLQLGALVALALAPGSTDAPAAVLLLCEAWEGIAATLRGGV